MPWLWMAELGLEEGYDGSLASARWEDRDGVAARLVAWPAGPRPHARAARADAGFVDPKGPATEVTVQLIEPGREPLYDDPAVQHLLRCLELWTEVGEGAITSLTRDPSHWAGSLFAGPVEIGGLAEIGPVRRGRLEAGFASARRQVLSGTQRNAGTPWPCAG